LETKAGKEKQGNNFRGVPICGLVGLALSTQLSLQRDILFDPRHWTQLPTADQLGPSRAFGRLLFGLDLQIFF
jgi:hypothetical protein